MKYDFFISSRYRNKDAVLELAQKIRDKRKSVYCFIESEASLKNVGSIDNDPEEVMAKLESTNDWWNSSKVQEIFESDMNALKTSDTIIVLLPGGKSTHIEAGVAYGVGKKLILIGEVETAESLYLIFDKHFKSIDEFINSIS